MNDPKRLRDDGVGPRELRDLLLAAEDDVLDEASTRRVRAELTSALPAGALVTSSPLVIALLAGALVAGGYAFTASRSSVPAAPAPAVSTVLIAAAPGLAVEPPPAPAPMLAPTDLPPAPPVARVVASPPRTATAPRADAGAVEASPREGLLLLQARRALESDPERALVLIGRHEREFPKSQLSPEREKLRSEARARMTTDR